MRNVLDLLGRKQPFDVDDAIKNGSERQRATAMLVREFCDSIKAKLDSVGLALRNITIGVDPNADLLDVRRQLQWLGLLEESKKENSLDAPENLPVVE